MKCVKVPIFFLYLMFILYFREIEMNKLTKES